MLAVPAAAACVDVGDIERGPAVSAGRGDSARVWEGTAWQASILELKAHLAEAVGDPAAARSCARRRRTLRRGRPAAGRGPLPIPRSRLGVARAAVGRPGLTGEPRSASRSPGPEPRSPPERPDHGREVSGDIRDDGNQPDRSQAAPQLRVVTPGRDADELNGRDRGQHAGREVVQATPHGSGKPLRRHQQHEDDAEDPARRVRAGSWPVAQPRRLTAIAATTPAIAPATMPTAGRTTETAAATDPPTTAATRRVVLNGGRSEQVPGCVPDEAEEESDSGVLSATTRTTSGAWPGAAQ